jgi:16S rRNA (uracil1498-N3)-methyltransferase
MKPEGSWCECRWTSKLGSGSLDICSVVQITPPPPPLAIAFAPVKGGGGGSDWLVQKLTEIGATDIFPLLPTKRSVVKWSRASSDIIGGGVSSSSTNIARLVKISREASMQSRRVHLPTIHPPIDIKSIAKMNGAAIADPSGSTLDASHTLVIIGPEGGWDAEELQLCEQRVSLGHTVLRSETAGVVAAALMAAAHRAKC